jgi:hypothetical protein
MNVLPDLLEKSIKEVQSIGRPGLQAPVEIRETGTWVATPDRVMSRFYHDMETAGLQEYQRSDWVGRNCYNII